MFLNSQDKTFWPWDGSQHIYVLIHKIDKMQGPSAKNLHRWVQTFFSAILPSKIFTHAPIVHVRLPMYSTGSAVIMLWVYYFCVNVGRNFLVTIPSMFDSILLSVISDMYSVCDILNYMY